MTIYKNSEIDALAGIKGDLNILAEEVFDSEHRDTSHRWKTISKLWNLSTRIQNLARDLETAPGTKK